MLKSPYFFRDTKAGINVALLAIPQGMAYALIAGLPLHFGLLASGVAAFIGGIVGGGRFITLGPTNATAVLLLGVFLQLQMVSSNGELTQNALLVLPSILVCTGVWLVLAGIFRISFLIKFISRTVITGYITAASFLIIINQMDTVFGLQKDLPLGTNFFQSGFYIFDSFSSHTPSSIYLSAFTLLCFYILKRNFHSLPNVAITLVLGSLAGQILIYQNFLLHYF